MLQKCFRNLLRVKNSRLFSSQTPILEIPDYLLKTRETKISKLTNDVTVASEYSSDNLITVGVWLDSGSRYETKEHNGLAHYAEHLTFKGTEKRTREIIELSIENKGAHLNAFTSREMAAYFMSVIKGDLDFALDTLSDILLNSTYSQKAVDDERSVIIRESQEIYSLKDEYTIDLLHEVAYKECGLGLTILGTKDSLNRIKRQHLLDFRTNNYTGNRLYLIGVGAVEHDQLESLGNKYFGGLPAFSNCNYTSKYTPGYIKDTHQHDFGTTVFAFEGCGWSSEDNIPMLLLQQIIGSFDYTRANTFSLNNNLLNGINPDSLNKLSAINTCYKDTGLFGILFEAPNAQIPQLSKHILRYFNRLCGSITESELATAQKKLFNELLTCCDGSNQIFDDIGRQLICYGRRVPIHELYYRIYTVTLDDMRRVVTKYFGDRDKLTVAASGDVSLLPTYDELKGYMD